MLGEGPEMPNETIADVILDELELILKNRDHRPRDQPATPEQVAADDAARKKKMDAFRAEIKACPNIDAALMRARVIMLDEQTTGLAFSGGGIRSGTFAVGFLQGLANLGLIGRFDYLSTVSGGGYAGAWLAAWLKREGDVKNVEQQLDYSRVHQARASRGTLALGATIDEEPQPMRHLRAFTSYMFPDPSPLSGDLWAVIMIWVRNVAVNLMMLFPLAMIVVLLARLGVFFFNFLNADNIPNLEWGWHFAWTFFIVGLFATMLSFRLNAGALPEFRVTSGKRPANSEAKAYVVLFATIVAAFSLTVCSRWILWHFGEWVGNLRSDTLHKTVLGGYFAPGTFLGKLLAPDTISGNLIGLISEHLDLMEPPSFVFMMLLFAIFMSAGAFILSVLEGKPSWPFVRAAFVAGASGGFLFVLVLGMIRTFARMNRPDLMATFAIPGALGVVIASMIVEVAIAGRAMKEAEREWWGRYSARLAIACILWLVGMGATLYVPGLFLAGGAMARVAIASGWVGATTLGVVTGRFVLPKLQAKGGGQFLAKLAALAPPIFLIGLLGVVGLLASLLLNSPSLNAPNASDFPPFTYYIAGVAQTSGWLIAALGIGFAMLAGLGFWLIDVNLFSLNAMYANRLVRCYLGASRPVDDWKPRWDDNPRDRRFAVGAPSVSDPDSPTRPVHYGMPPRDPNPVTKFAPKDDMPLVDLRIGQDYHAQYPTTDRTPRTYWGPHLLINATLNLVGGQDLAWRSRKGESFVLSPLYCGAKTVGYVKVPETGDVLDNLTLGRAIAISGAAVDPNMRFYQSRSLTALLTLFNARLGSWMQNPLPAKGLGKQIVSWLMKIPSQAQWDARGPRFGGFLLTELFGKTDALKPYVHLSDGGHFENLGVYELIRRRCRYIVALDAGDESTASDSNLATLIRLCRIDFGIRIQINTDALQPKGGVENLSRTHAVIGSIRYDDVDQGELPGVFVYVKISMTGDEPPDLQNYHRSDSKFPYQPTDLRQSFDEEQFECYRCLGDHIATEVFEGAVDRVREVERAKTVDYVPRLFSALQSQWDDAPETQDEDFIASSQAWIAIQKDLRSDHALARLSHQLYPELLPPPSDAPGAPTPSEYARAEIHAVSQMLQIMENTWLSLGLRKRTDLPMNRGWVNVFRKWANTLAFQALWPELRTEYSSDFVRFCEDELHIKADAPMCLQLGDPLPAAADPTFEADAIALLTEEYEREWPDPAIPKLGALIAQADLLRPSPKDKPPVWLIVQNPSRPLSPKGGSAGKSVVVGIVLAARFDLAAMNASFPGLVIPPAALFNGHPVEFFVWMRRGYRATNLGAPRVREILSDKLHLALGLKTKDDLPTLWARYPKGGEHGDHDHERSVWLNFLARFNFRHVYPKAPGAWKFTLLKR